VFVQSVAMEKVQIYISDVLHVTPLSKNYSAQFIPIVKITCFSLKVFVVATFHAAFLVAYWKLLAVYLHEWSNYENNTLVGL
jgi:hypothetical protein